MDCKSVGNQYCPCHFSTMYASGCFLRHFFQLIRFLICFICYFFNIAVVTTYSKHLCRGHIFPIGLPGCFWGAVNRAFCRHLLLANSTQYLTIRRWISHTDVTFYKTFYRHLSHVFYCKLGIEISNTGSQHTVSGLPTAIA